MSRKLGYGTEFSEPGTTPSSPHETGLHGSKPSALSASSEALFAKLIAL